MMRRLLVLAACAAWLVIAGAAHAQVLRTFGTRYSTNQKGDITLIANTLMSCSGGGQCTNGRNGSGGSVNDNDFNMAYIDRDADGTTFSSSSATLGLPAGSTVLFAGLSWGGDNNTAARNTCRFGTPAAGYVTITASQLDNAGRDYSAFADVTTRVQAGGNGVYWCANVLSTPGVTNVHAGWALVVAYADPAGTLRNLVVLDGYAHVSNTTNVTTTITGFVTPPAGIVNCRLGVVAYEGDFGYVGDSFRINGNALSDGLNPGNNFFNSSITRFGAQVTNKNPNFVNQLGFDADLLSVNSVLANGATSATVQLTSSQDEYYPAVVTFATDLYAPVFDDANLTKTVADLNGAPVRPGDILEYTLTMRNVGQDHAVQTVLRDTLASTLTYVAGSLQIGTGPNAGTKTDLANDDQMEYVAATRTVVARLGTGANASSGGQIDINSQTTVKFRAQVTPPAPTGTLVLNQGALAFVAQQSGVAFKARSDGDATQGGTQPTTVSTVSVLMSGTVFEDVNYGGGAGRSRAAAAGAPVVGARVELYDASGNFAGSTASDATGAYTLDGYPAGSYRVRVVNSSVLSTRTGAVAGLLPVQTWRTDATSGAPVAVTDRVGGENPVLADAAANTTNAALATLTTATTAVQSLSSVTFGNTNLAGLDFGFNFDTIVNANDAGQGSLRQFLLNANALGNTGLVQAGLTAGVETSVFMVSDGLAHPGLRAGLPSGLTAGAVTITLATPLPAITGTATRVDGRTQTTNIGDTNPALLSGSSTVGTDALAVASVNGPELELRAGGSIAIGFDVQAADVALSDLALLGMGSTPGNDASAAVRVGAAAPRAVIERCVLGARANSFTDPGAVLRTKSDQVRVLGGDNGVLRDCLIGFGAGSAAALTAASDGWQMDGCMLLGNTSGNATLGQVLLAASGAFTATRTLVQSGEGPGLDALTSTGNVSLTNLTLRLNGRGGSVTAGVRAGGSGGTVSRCELLDNYGAGVQVTSGASAWIVSRCAFSGNGSTTTSAGGPGSSQVGMDLQSASDDAARGTSPYVTRNDNNDADAGGNALVNFPVLAGAVMANGSFTLSGWARPGSVIELYVSDGDASGFGEGRTYVTTFTEGSAADLDAGTSAYTSPVNGLNQGADNTNRFRFTGSLPPGVAVGARLTATATLAAGTSEFSGVATVATGVSVTGFAYADVDHDAQRDGSEAGTGLTLWAKLVPASAASASQVVAVNAATGSYAFTFVSAGPWTVVLDDSDSPSDLVSGVPSGWLATEHASGTLLTNINATDVAAGNFGLFNGSLAQGVVFRDDGAGTGVANDGALEPGESALAGQRVRLTSTGCALGVCDSALTDGSGAFALWLPAAGAGTVSVRAAQPAGWLATGGNAGSAPGSYSRANNTVTLTATPGVVYDGLAFGNVPPNLWSAPGAQGVAGGTPAYYRHTYTAQSGGTVSFTTSTAPVPPVSGWGLTLWRDLDCDGVLDAGETALPASLTLATGEQVCVIAKHQAPLGASAGARETATLTASFSYANASPALSDRDSLDDVTTITFANGLVITKSVDRAAAAPGSFLVYTISYSNPGNVALSNIVIRDATPPWTVFDSATCATTGSGISGCTLTQQPASGATGTLAWSLAGALVPGGSGSVSFRVRVN
ncbi:MAG: carboxypeptidase regulatory-like domain-containing protein [Candidatus Eisenbacteria bacterium]